LLNLKPITIWRDEIVVSALQSACM